MPATRTLGALAAALCPLLLPACGALEPMPRSSSPIVYTPGTVQEQLRQVQLAGARSGVNPGVRNPVAVERSVAGILREPSGGTGNVTAGAPVAVNPGVGGVTRAPGVGAPTR